MVGPRTPKKQYYLDFILRARGFETDFHLTGNEPEQVTDLAAAFNADKFRALYDLSFKDPEDWYSPSLRYLVRVGSEFIRNLSRAEDLEEKRSSVQLPECSTDAIASSVPFISGSEYVTPKWVAALWARLLDVFRSDISKYEGKVEIYFSERNDGIRTPGRIFFHLVENRNSDQYPFAFMATYTPENEKGNKHLPLRCALEEYRDDERKMLQLLSNLSSAADKSPFISKFIESGELFHPLWFTSGEAFQFLKEIEIYESCGILCRIPNWWRRRGTTDAYMHIDGSSMMGADSILSCRPSLYVDGELLTEEEVRYLLSQTEGLAMLKGRWVEVDHAKLKHLLSKMEGMSEMCENGVGILDALRMTVGLDSKEDAVRVANTDWVAAFTKAFAGEGTKGFAVPKTFKGKLRNYQEIGAGWLAYMRSIGFGCCLADDMGLGKTVQVLAFLESRRSTDRRNLLVVPASLLGNWEKEASKFTPKLRCGIVRGGKDVPGDEDLTVTTYGTLLRNKQLSEIEWDNVFLDEAQAIKNSTSKQSQMVRSLKTKGRFALTGTPVENNLSDLWSLFDFIVPGLLGDKHEFDSFSRSLTSGDTGYARLRTMISPFMLRRLKTDKSIAGDLPSKMEIDEYVDLSKKQTVLYTKLLEDMKDTLMNAPPQGRMGLVLVMLQKFKQICNHPDQYLGTGDYPETDSGKFQMLRQLCETILEKREKVLVFTQYREMTEPLCKFLTEVFGREGLVFHGGITPKERTKIVEKFNSEDVYVPFMVISLKAGGVGLNLTSANHVIHFDRWWNPAVENQATDRAYRIGQKKNVIVHKFICRGTLEEKIDALINSKKELAQNVVSEGEHWISDMDNAELMELFKLEV